MLLGSFFFKNRARRALKGNWQTALLVTFFAGILVTVSQVCQSVVMQDIEAITASIASAVSAMPEGVTTESTQYHEVLDLYRRLFSAIGAVPQGTYITLLAVNVLALVISPVLGVSCSRYFIHRIDGQELGFREGVLGRMHIWHRALWLYTVMFVRIFLWSLLLIIPGIIAAIRYSMAPYYLAENPDMKATEAINRSKKAMSGMKMTYFMLELSFVGWNLLVNVVQLFLVDISPVIALVAAQFLSLAVSTYMNASVAAFYCAVSRLDGIETLFRDMRGTMKQMGMDDNEIDAAGLGEKPESDDGGDED